MGSKKDPIDATPHDTTIETVKKVKEKAAGLWDLMRYANFTDYVMLTGAFVFAAISGALIPATSMIFKGITDTLIRGQQEWKAGDLDMERFTSEILHFCLLYLLLGVGEFILGFISMSCAYTCCERQLHAIRKKYFRAILRQDMEWYDGNNAGAITDRMSTGIEKIKSGAGDKIAFAITSIACAVSGVILAFVMCWQMTLVMLIIAPVMIIATLISGRLLNNVSKEEHTVLREAGGVATEVISGIKTVMAFNAQAFEIQRYKKIIDDALKIASKKTIINAIFTAIPLFLMFGSMVFAFWYGAFLMQHGLVTPGTIFGVFWSVLIGVLTLSSCAPQFSVILEARLAVRDIMKIIDRRPPIDCTNPGGLRPETVKGRIEFKNIHFAYPTRRDVKILNGISYCAEPGQTIALVGHSGCGKSTMVGLLLRYYEQQMGTVTLDGIPLRDLNIEWLRNTIGVVSQEPVIFSNTVEYNLRLGADDLTLEDIERACLQANAHDFITKLPEGYQTMIGEGNVQLSGGQKQRIAIARALVRQPKILLLDEATSALDTESEKVVQEALDHAREGRTTLCIAHRLQTIRTSDRIIVFDKGNIVEDGTHVSLMAKNEIYAKMVRAQEIEKSEEQTALSDVEDEYILRATASPTSETSRLSDKEIRKMSERLRQSMISVKSLEHEFEFEDAREVLAEECGREATLFDIIRFARQEWTQLIFALIVTGIRGLIWPLFAIIYGKLFLVMSHPSDDVTGDVLGVCIWFLALAFVALATTFSSGTLFGRVGESVAQRMRISAYANMLRQDATYFDDTKHNVGAISSRLSQDAPNVKAAIDQRLAEVLQGLVSLIAGVIVAFTFGWNMAPIGLITALILVVAQSAVGQYLKWRGQKDMNSANEASRILSESVLNVKTIQALTRERTMYEAFCEASERPHSRAITRGLWQSVSFAMANAFINTNFAIAYSFGLFLIKNHWTSPFVVFQVIESLNMASVSVMAAATYFPEYVRMRISAGAIFRMMNERPQIDSMNDVGTTPEIEGDIAFKHVYFSYPARRRNLILNDADVRAKNGQTVALVGPSGSGKSTLIQLIERYYDVLAGQVTIDNCDVRDLNLRHLRDHMAIVGQEPTLFNLTIRENITYGLEEISEEKVIEAAKLANIHSFVENLPEKYDTKVGQRGGRLSGGQKQRIAIARAIVRDPKILLLDEATSALDTESEKIVQAALDRASAGRTCLVVAHRLSTIQNADLIVVFKDGRVLEKGTHQSLLSRRGLYYRLVQKQQ